MTATSRLCHTSRMTIRGGAVLLAAALTFTLTGAPALAGPHARPEGSTTRIAVIQQFYVHTKADGPAAAGSWLFQRDGNLLHAAQPNKDADRLLRLRMGETVDMRANDWYFRGTVVGYDDRAVDGLVVLVKKSSGATARVFLNPIQGES